MLEEGREVVPLAKPRDLQVDAAHASIEGALASPVATVKTLPVARVPARTDMLVELELHDLLQGVLEYFPHRVAGAAQKAVVVLAWPRYDRIGHRVLLVGLNTRSVRSMAACPFFGLGADRY